MSPYEIELLLNIHCCPSELSQAKVPLLSRTLREFNNAGIIEPGNSNSGWQTTDKGSILVEMLCATPFPVDAWIDPRTIEVIEQ